jgi:hypothetical protein
MPGGSKLVGDAAPAVGVVLAAVDAVGVGDDAADVAAGGPDDEHAVISAAMTTATQFRTQRA